MQACFVRVSGTVKTVPYDDIDKHNGAFRFDDIDKHNGAFRFDHIDKRNSAFRFEDIDKHNGAFRFPVGNGLDRSAFLKNPQISLNKQAHTVRPYKESKICAKFRL